MNIKILKYPRTCFSSWHVELYIWLRQDRIVFKEKVSEYSVRNREMECEGMDFVGFTCKGFYI